MQVGWISGNETLNGRMLLGGSGRARLLSPSEVDEDAGLQLLQARINAELSTPSISPLEFQDEVSIALALRLVSVHITPPPPGWRLTLPRPVAAIMQIRAGESEVAALFVQSHIEFWTIEMLRSSINIPLNQFI